MHHSKGAHPNVNELIHRQHSSKALILIVAAGQRTDSNVSAAQQPLGTAFEQPYFAWHPCKAMPKRFLEHDATHAWLCQAKSAAD